MTLTTRQIVNRFRKYAPQDEQDILCYCDVSLRYLNDGVYRNVYRVDDRPLVVKVPTEEEGDGVAHAVTELEAFDIINTDKRFSYFRRYLPKVYYADKTTGVILMQEYTPLDGMRKSRRRKYIDDAYCLGSQIASAFAVDDWDGHDGNFAVDDEGKLIVLDMGFLVVN